MFNQVKKHNRTAVMVTHEQDEVQDYLDKILQFFLLIN